MIQSSFCLSWQLRLFLQSVPTVNFVSNYAIREAIKVEKNIKWMGEASVIFHS